MAAYWRSPYRELSTCCRPANHSTMKFEQSLYLTRAKTAMHSSRCDWFDDALYPSTNRNVKPDPDLTRSNTTIKSILKATKPAINTRRGFLSGKEQGCNTSKQSNDDTASPEPPQKEQKKKVTFGESKDMGDESESTTKTSIQFMNRRCQSMAMKRISHSRLLEESALKKLNRLIAGGGTEENILPAVTGKGIISPRHRRFQRLSKPICNHDPDLKCIQCVRNDGEGGDNGDRLGGKMNTRDRCIIKPNINMKSGEIKAWDNNSTNIPDSNYMKLRQLPEHDVNNECVQSLPFTREVIERSSGNGQQNPISDNRKKYHRLLPGRYPYNSGAIQIKKLLVPDQQTNVVSEPSCETGGGGGGEGENEVIDLHNNVLTNVKQKVSTNQPSNLSLRKSNRRAAASRTRVNSSTRIPTIASGCITDASVLQTDDGTNIDNISFDSDYVNTSSFNKTKSPKDKTSEILHWLDDVHQKQTLTPRLARYNSLQSEQQMC